jgi:hypothetical protein
MSTRANESNGLGGWVEDTTSEGSLPLEERLRGRLQVERGASLLEEQINEELHLNGCNDASTLYPSTFGFDVDDHDPESACCKFCTSFGRESHTVSYPFSSEKFLTHLSSQHPTKWSQYQCLVSAEQKSDFFLSAAHHQQYHQQQ